MSSPKVILFIGHHKVGTTALQEFLSQNYISLLRGGILYPMVETESLTRILGAAIFDEAVPSGHFNLRVPHNALAFRMLSDIDARWSVPAYHGDLPATDQMLNAIAQQINIFAPQTVVLCAEVFANFGATSIELIRVLKAFFVGSEITIVATLRRPDEYLASWHAQRLKFPHKVMPLRAAGTARYYDKIHFDYRRMLEPWLEVMGQDQLVLRSYSDVLANGGSIADFISATQIVCPSGLDYSVVRNLSLRRCFVEIARQAIHNLPKTAAMQIVDHLLALGQETGFRPNSEIEMFGKANRKEMTERFLPIHQWLSDLTGAPFFADLKQMSEILPVPEMKAARETLAMLRGRADFMNDLGQLAQEFLRDLRL